MAARPLTPDHVASIKLARHYLTEMSATLDRMERDEDARPVALLSMRMNSLNLTGAIDGINAANVNAGFAVVV